MTQTDLRHRFMYHQPFGNQPQRYQELRNAGYDFAMLVAATTPESREQSLALTKIEEAIMWANAAIARNEKPPYPGAKEAQDGP